MPGGIGQQKAIDMKDIAHHAHRHLSSYRLRTRAHVASFKGDKQGLGIGKRSKKRFTAQQMVMLLGALAHNVIVWARHWLASPTLHHYGTVRMVRDVFHISGFLLTDTLGQVVQIVLNQAAPLAPSLVDPLCALLARTHVAVNLGQTQVNKYSITHEQMHLRALYTMQLCTASPPGVG